MSQNSFRALAQMIHRKLLKKGKTAMRYTLFSMMAAFLAVLFAACGGPKGKTLEPLPTEFEVERDADACAADEAPAWCTETLTVEMCVKVGDTNDDGLKEISCQSLEFTPTDATQTFDPAPIEAGQYAEAHFRYSGLSLDEDTVMESCDGGDRPEVEELLAEAEDDAYHFCVRIRETNSGGTGGGTDGGTDPVQDSCFRAVNSAMEVQTDCVWSFNGQMNATSDPDAVDCDDGLFKAGLLVGASYNVEAVCDTLEGDDSFVITEGTTDYDVLVEEPPTGGTDDPPSALCACAVDPMGDPINGADFELKSEGPVMSDPVYADYSCADHCLYLEVNPGTHTVRAIDGSSSAEMEFIVSEGQLTTGDIYVYGYDYPDGEMCTEDHAFICDAFINGQPVTVGEFSLEAQLGVGDGNGCDTAGINDYSVYRVVSVTGTDCPDWENGDCRFLPVGAENDPPSNDAAANPVWSCDFTGMDSNQLLNDYVVGLEDTNLQMSLERNLWLYNGAAN